jgi:hypothetical protein
VNVAGDNKMLAERLSALYYKLLYKIYQEYFPVTKAIESSDLVLQLVGIIREMDLDIKRFELRRIAESSIEEIRCI